MAVRKLARKTTYGLGLRFDKKLGMYYAPLDIDGETYKDYFTKDEVREISKTAKKLREKLKTEKPGRSARAIRSRVSRVVLPTKSYRAIVSSSISKRAVTTGYGHDLFIYTAILPFAPELSYDEFEMAITKEAIRVYWANYNNITYDVAAEILELSGLNIQNYEGEYDPDRDSYPDDMELDDLF